MIRFLIVFFTLYGGIHLLFYRRFCAAFPQAVGKRRFLLATLLAAGTIAPLLTRVAERGGVESFARAVAIPGYLWMAVIFLFFSLSMVIVPIDLLTGRRMGPRPRFLIPLLLSIVLTLYGIFEARHLTVERIRVETPKLTTGTTVRIVFFSDLHLGLLTTDRFLQRVTAVIRQQRPDILVSGGDLIDGYGTIDGKLLGTFREIRPRLGSFAITGNHEYYVGIDEAMAKTAEAGFVPLRGETVETGGIVLMGEDDRTGIRMGSHRPLKDPAPSGRFRILLRHQPFRDDPPADLQLSGHVHKGQIFPFNLVTWLRFRVPTGLSRKPDGSLLYVGRGTGTWGPPVRLLAPPEITVVEVAGTAPPRE